MKVREAPAPFRVLLLAVLVLIGFAWLIHVALLLWFPFQLEYGEGPVVQLAQLINYDVPIYRPIDRPPYLACLYAPLHLQLSARWMGPQPSLWSGRLIAAAATLFLLATMFAYLREKAGSGWALFGVLAFLAHPLVFNWSALNRVDMLALALAGTALFTAARALEPSGQPRYDLLVGLGLVGAFFTKQSYLAPWAAVLLAYAVRDRRRALKLAAWTSGLAALILWSLARDTPGVILLNLFRYHVVSYLPSQMLFHFGWYLPGVAPLLILAAAYLARHPFTLWPLFLGAALVMAVGSGREGGYYNYFLEFHLALTVTASLGASRRGWALAALQLLLGLFWKLPPSLEPPLVYVWYETRQVYQGRLPHYLEARLRTAELKPYLDHYRGGPVLAENLANPVVMGRFPWFCDLSTFKALAGSGLFPEEILAEAVERQEFRLIILEKLDGSFRLSPRAVAAVKRRYVKVGQAGVDSIFLPRRAP